MIQIQEEIHHFVVWEGGLRGIKIVNKTLVNKVALPIHLHGLKWIQCSVGVGKRLRSLLPDPNPNTAKIPGPMDARSSSSVGLGFGTRIGITQLFPTLALDKHRFPCSFGPRVDVQVACRQRLPVHHLGLERRSLLLWMVIAHLLQSQLGL